MNLCLDKYLEVVTLFDTSNSLIEIIKKWFNKLTVKQNVCLNLNEKSYIKKCVFCVCDPVQKG